MGINYCLTNRLIKRRFKYKGRNQDGGASKTVRFIVVGPSLIDGSIADETTGVSGPLGIG